MTEDRHFKLKCYSNCLAAATSRCVTADLCCVTQKAGFNHLSGPSCSILLSSLSVVQESSALRYEMAMKF